MMSSNNFDPSQFSHGGDTGMFGSGMFGSSGGGGGNLGSNMGGGIASILGGLFGDSGAPYGDAMKQFKKYFQQANQYQNPFYKAGLGGMENYQKWLSGMQDPSGFINKLMGGYQESPWAKNLQNQSMRAGTNAASAGGLSGSTPFAMQMQQNANNISSEDQQKWLANALGINSQYGAGQGALMQGGQNAGNFLSQLAMMMGNNMGAGAYGQRAGRQQDLNNIFGGIGDITSSLPWEKMLPFLV